MSNKESLKLDFTVSRDQIQSEQAFTKLLLQESPAKELSRLFGETIFGQDEACDAVARRITRVESGFTDPNRPLSTFMFLGPTGVGKTEMGKAMARYLYQDRWQERFIRIDCTEFQDSASIHRMKGSDPKYVGYGAPVLIMPEQIEDGAVIVFDEIEKAHSDFWKWLMPITEEGTTKVFLTTDEVDANDKNIVKPVELNFRKSYLIFTSNEGSVQMQRARAGGRKSIGYSSSTSSGIDYQEVAKDVLKNGTFKNFPEFLGRIDTVVGFNELNMEDCENIYNKFLMEFSNSQRSIDENESIFLTTTPELKDHILAEASLGSFGARNIRHTMDKILIDAAADYKAAKIFSGNVLLIGDIENGEVVFWMSQMNSIIHKEENEYVEEIDIFEERQPLPEPELQE